MVLNLYLDDCSNSDLLARLLQQAGHRVIRPTDAHVSLVGEEDDIHFAFAAMNDFTIITKNPSDFQHLHDLDSQHGGILAIYQDNDPARDMSDAEIVKAISNLEASTNRGGAPIPRSFHCLNNWRY